MDGLDSRLLARFSTQFPNYSQLQECTATHQRKVLQDMLQAAIRAETEKTNIRTIASEALGAGQAFSAQANASQAEKTISHYKSGDDGQQVRQHGQPWPPSLLWVWWTSPVVLS